MKLMPKFRQLALQRTAIGKRGGFGNRSGLDWEAWARKRNQRPLV